MHQSKPSSLILVREDLSISPLCRNFWIQDVMGLRAMAGIKSWEAAEAYDDSLG